MILNLPERMNMLRHSGDHVSEKEVFLIVLAIGEEKISDGLLFL